jgi:hypothetical protein
MSWKNRTDYLAYLEMKRKAVKKELKLRGGPHVKKVPLGLKVKPRRGAQRFSRLVPFLTGRSEPYFGFIAARPKRAPTCTPDQAQWNETGVAELAQKSALADAIVARVADLTENSNSPSAINAACSAQDAYTPPETLWYYPCVPEGPEIIAAYNRFIDHFNNALTALGRATDLLMANADRE